MMARRTVPVAAEGIPAGEQTLDELFILYVAAGRRAREASDAYDRAYECMPAWAQYGPRIMRGDGSYGEDVTSWPEIENVPEPSGTIVCHVIRPSVSETWKNRTMLLGPKNSAGLMEPTDTPEAKERLRQRQENRRKVRLAAIAAVRRIIGRVRQQRAERVKAGVAATAAAQEAAWSERDKIEDRIIAQIRGGSYAELAAEAMLQYRAVSCGPMSDQDWEVEWIRKVLLARLLPNLSGFLRLLAHDLVLGDGARTIEHTLLYGGVPSDADALDVVASAYVEGVAA